MDQGPVAELLPTLYRAVLDAVAELERRGFRHEAAQIRSDATRAYSQAWNATAARRLQALLARSQRATDGRRLQRRGVLASVQRRLDLDRTSA
jgi:hypothetical protein